MTAPPVAVPVAPGLAVQPDAAARRVVDGAALNEQSFHMGPVHPRGIVGDDGADAHAARPAQYALLALAELPAVAVSFVAVGTVDILRPAFLDDDASHRRPADPLPEGRPDDQPVAQGKHGEALPVDERRLHLSRVGGIGVGNGQMPDGPVTLVGQAHRLGGIFRIAESALPVNEGLLPLAVGVDEDGLLRRSGAPRCQGFAGPGTASAQQQAVSGGKGMVIGLGQGPPCRLRRASVGVVVALPAVQVVVHIVSSLCDSLCTLFTMVLIIFSPLSLGYGTP